MKSALVTQSHLTCPQCRGRGRVRSPESSALEALRKVQSSAFAGGIKCIKIHMHPVAALILLNDKRAKITEFETKSDTRIVLYPDNRKRTGEYEIELINDRGKSQKTGAKNNNPKRKNYNRRRRNYKGNRRRNTPPANPA